MDLTAEIKISENVLSLFGALYAFEKADRSGRRPGNWANANAAFTFP